MNDIEIVQVNYHDQQHAKDLVYLLNEYALDPMGGAEALPVEVQAALPSGMADVAGAVSFIAYTTSNEPVGLLNAFQGFSTFRCRPLLNIHDIVVIRHYRRQGVCEQMLQAAEAYALAIGCCKMTLEVLDNNSSAKKAYQKYGFSGYELDPKAGSAVFWQKEIISG